MEKRLGESLGLPACLPGLRHMDPGHTRGRTPIGNGDLRMGTSFDARRCHKADGTSLRVSGVCPADEKENFSSRGFVDTIRTFITGPGLSMERLTALTRLILTILAVWIVVLGPASAKDYLDYYEEGEFALRVEKWDRAIDLFTKALQGNPSFFVAYHNCAIAYSKKGEYDKSIQDLKQAIKLNPDYPDAYGLMGLVYEIMKDYPSAVQVYKEALTREKRPSVRITIEKYLQDAEAKLKKK